MSTLKTEKPSQPPAATSGRPARETTRVNAWLKERYASAFAEAFYADGYLEVEEVDAAAVDRIVTEKGTASRLKADLERRSRGAMVPPDLPAGTTLDLSKPQVTSAQGITFTVPTTLSVKRTEDAIQSPNALQNADWVVIARNASLLYGFRMDGAGPVRARRPVLEWVVPDRIDFARSEIYQARVESTVTYTEETAAYVRCGFDKQSATVGLPFCAASFERSHKERTARASSHKELHQVGMWKYPRVTLFLDDCTRVSEAFVAAVRDALAMIDPREAIRQVLLDYGHAVPLEVVLGGQLHFESVRTEDSSTTEKQVEQEIKAAVEAKYQGFSASASAAQGSSTSHSAASVALAEQTSFDGLGGDTTLVSSPADWAPTVKDPRLWAVIGNERVASTLDLLDPLLKAEVLQHWTVPQYPELAAIDEPLAVPANCVARATTPGFLLGMRECVVGPTGGQVGSVLLASASQDRDALHDTGLTCTARAHASRPGDLWHDASGVSLPVAGYADYGVWLEDVPPHAAPARLRLGFARTRFDFGAWRPFPFGTAQTLAEDGFLAVQLCSEGAEWGEVTVTSGTTLVSAVAVDAPYQPKATTCVPVRAGTSVTVTPTFRTGAGAGKPATTPPGRVVVRFIPLAAEWTMGPGVTVEPNTHVVAATDGVLHAQLDAVSDGPRGVVRLYSASADPWAAASVHTYLPHDRRVRYDAALLPVGKDTTYLASFTPSAGAPALTLTWTPIVRTHP